jgi:hypothetical protein
LQQRIEELDAADKYTEAIKLGEELLALRTKVQGADHWQTADQKWALVALQKVDALAIGTVSAFSESAKAW